LVNAVAAINADFNGNGIVDAADYAVWRSTRDQAGAALAADADGNGIIDLDDYQLWRARFGTTTLARGADNSEADPLPPLPSSTAPWSTAVPEPPSCLLAALCFLAGTTLRSEYGRHASCQFCSTSPLRPGNPRS
jgi:hypothetical protein